MPNPYWEESLRQQAGLDQAVINYSADHQQVQNAISQLYELLIKWLHGFTDQDRSYITIAIGCTGGQHRSVFIAEQLLALFKQHEHDVQKRYRELSR